jgi:hypothetical protein
MNRRLFVGLGTVTVIGLIQAPARSSTYVNVPLYMTEQGRLFDSTGAPLTGTSVSLTLALYNDKQNGTPSQTVSTSGPLLWTETQTGITLDSGFFSVILGSTSPLSQAIFQNAAQAGQSLYLGITVNTDPEMSPRQPLNTVPYAFVATNA